MNDVQIRRLLETEYYLADRLLETCLYQTGRPRSYDFLIEKLRANPEFFLGLYLDDELIGVIQGFPRDDYLLLSELSVDAHFRHRGFGTMLVKEFEDAARKRGFGKIKLGADDKAVEFYLKNRYTPLLFVQVNGTKVTSFIETLEKKHDLDVLHVSMENGMTGIEFSVKGVNLSELETIKREFKPISAQFLFIKLL